MCSPACWFALCTPSARAWHLSTWVIFIDALPSRGLELFLCSFTSIAFHFLCLIPELASLCNQDNNENMAIILSHVPLIGWLKKLQQNCRRVHASLAASQVNNSSWEAYIVFHSSVDWFRHLLAVSVNKYIMLQTSLLFDDQQRGVLSIHIALI